MTSYRRIQILCVVVLAMFFVALAILALQRPRTILIAGKVTDQAGNPVPCKIWIMVGKPGDMSGKHDQSGDRIVDAPNGTFAFQESNWPRLSVCAYAQGYKPKGINFPSKGCYPAEEIVLEPATGPAATKPVLKNFIRPELQKTKNKPKWNWPDSLPEPMDFGLRPPD